MSRTIEFEDEGGWHVRGGPCPWCDELDYDYPCDTEGCEGIVHSIYLWDEYFDEDEDDSFPVFDMRCDRCNYEIIH